MQAAQGKNLNALKLGPLKNVSPSLPLSLSQLSNALSVAGAILLRYFECHVSS